MTCQVQLKQKIKNLEFVLPNPNVTLQNSMKFTELVTLAAVSSISYLRNIFPESAFDPLKINGKSVWLLKGSKDIPGTLTLIRWMKAAMDAVREHILKKMILVIEKQNERKTLETYTFNFAYNVDAINDELSSKTTGQESLVESMDSKVSPENIQKAIQDLICRILVLTENMEPLPTDCEVGVRLEFYDNVPETYKLPAIFTAVESLNIKFPCEIHSLKLGDVESKFIGIALRAKSVTNKIVNEVLKPMEEAREDFNFDVDDFFHTNQDDILDEVQPSQEEPTALYNYSIKTPTIAPSEVGDEATNVAETMSTISLKENEVKCICECNNSSNALINCQSCQTFQHKACYKLLDDDTISQHVCVDCHESTDMICIDPSLVSKENRKFEALYRRALVICLNRSRVSSKTFVDQLDLTRQNAQNIFNQLNTDGFLHHTTGKGYIRTVKKEYLRENAFTKYFTTSSVTNIESTETQVNLTRRQLQDSDNGSVASLKRRSTQVDEYCQRKRLKYATNQGQTNIQLYS